MSGDKSDQEAYAAGQLREFIQGNVDGKPNDWVHKVAGLVDDEETLRLISYYISLYQDRGKDFTETRLYEVIVQTAATKSASNALDQGNLSKMQGHVGLVDHTEDANDPSVRDWMRRRVVDEAYVGFITGGMGKGKTDFALELADGWQFETRGQLASNMEHWQDQDRCIQDFTELEDWFNQGGDKLFIYDESGQSAKGGGHSGIAAAALANMIRLIRKGDKAQPDDKRCFLFIDQTEMGIEKDLRRLVREAGDTWRKKSQKTVELYEDIVNGLPDKPQKTVRNVSATRFSYSTNGAADFDLTSALDGDQGDGDQGDGGRDVLIAMALRSYLNNSHLSTRDVAEQTLDGEFSKSWVADRVREWKKGQYRDLVDANSVDYDPEN